MNATNANNNANPDALKYQIKRQSNMKKQAVEERDSEHSFLREAWAMLALQNEDKVTHAIWRYAEATKPFVRIENSSHIGIYTYIGDYTNKKGVTSKAHYTQHDNYIGSVAKLGKKPISYAGFFKVSKTLFKIHDDVYLANTKCPLFVPISNKPIDEPTDDEEVEAPAPAPTPEPESEVEVEAEAEPTPAPAPKPKRKAPTFIPKATPVKK
jgi:hypothetical protein